MCGRTSPLFPILALVACAAPAQHAITATYQCGQEQISIAIQGDNLSLKTDTGEFALTRVIAASGAKYASPADETTYFWHRGLTALLSIRGTLAPECSRLALQR